MKIIKIVDAIFINKRGQMLLQLRDSNPNIKGSGLWGLIGGGIKENETPVNALKREVYEEMQIKINTIKKIKDVSDVHLGITYLHYIFHVPISFNGSKVFIKEGIKAQFFEVDEITKLSLVPWFNHLYLPIIKSLTA